MEAGASKARCGNGNPQEVIKPGRAQVVCFDMHDHRVVFDLPHIVFAKPQRFPVSEAGLIKQAKVVGIEYPALSVRIVELDPCAIPKTCRIGHVCPLCLSVPASGLS